ncbi:hypothetical protein GCM10023231_00300 [Olivibacter ginsenosidimutans]|uniref:DUF1795 domain-containing protein n=1 Tax=Olivibacter ginsenosidimutans TaxID=1176537 RepID=A0ABP9AAN5_9SPHI
MKMSLYTGIVLSIIWCANFCTTYAQSLQLDTSLFEPYHVDIRKESDEGFLTTYYEMVNANDNSRPFEIIITQTSSKLMDSNGVVEGIEKNLKNYLPESRLNLLKKVEKANNSRRLYQFYQKNATILMLMQESDGMFTMIEAEFPDDELQKVPIEKWQDIFWNAK